MNDDNDRNDEPSLGSETDRINEIIISLFTNLFVNGDEQSIKDASTGAVDVLETIKIWVSTALDEAKEVNCQCPACDEAVFNLTKALESVNDSITQAQGIATPTALTAAFALGSSAAQLILIPTLAVIMGKMAQHAHDMARSILEGKITELSIDGPPCSNCGACGKDTGDDTKKPN